MKHYKDFSKTYIGSSDGASLILAGGGDDGLELKELHFGEDGDYHAYIIDDSEVEIPTHYYKAAEFKYYMKIYDDDGLITRYRADKIIVYRAAQMGCIIQLINKRS